MLARKFKLGSEKNISDIFKKGSFIKGKFLNMVFMPNDKAPLFAAAVGSKLLKNATDRNKVRRRIFEAIRLNGLELTKGKNYDIVFVARAGADKAEYDDICGDIVQLLKRL